MEAMIKIVSILLGIGLAVISGKVILDHGPLLSEKPVNILLVAPAILVAATGMFILYRAVKDIFVPEPAKLNNLKHVLKH